MSVYQTSVDHVLFTVLDNKLLNQVANAYKEALDEGFNKEEEIQVRKMKIKLGKKFLLKETETIPENFNVDDYINDNRELLKRSIGGFLAFHGWTMAKLCDYFTKNNRVLSPITAVTVE